MNHFFIFIVVSSLNIVVPSTQIVGEQYEVLFQYEKPPGSEFIFYVIEDPNSPTIVSEKILFLTKIINGIKFRHVPKTKSYNWFYFDQVEASKTYDASISFNVSKSVYIFRSTCLI